MFSFAKKLTQFTQTQGASKAALSTPSRFVISDLGMLTYASDEFLTTASLAEADMGHRHISSIFEFTDPDLNLQNLNPGAHDIRIHATNKTKHFHFDWLTTGTNEIFLIASEIQDLEATEPGLNKFMQRFETKILSKIKRDTANQKRRKSDFIPDLQPFFNLSGDIMIVADENGTIKRTNRQFTDLFGETETDTSAPTKHLTDIFHIEDKPFARRAIQTLNFEEKKTNAAGTAHSSIIDFEARIITSDFKSKTSHWRAQRIDDYIYCMGQDLTPLVSQREALTRRETQLTQAESIGRMGHWRWPIGTDNIEWSSQLYTIFGVDQDTFNPSFDTMRAMIDRSDMGRVNQAFQRAVIEQKDYDMEFSIQRPDGEIRYIRCEGRCSIDDEDEVIALFGIMQDMTERVLYEQELKEAKDASERAYAAKSQFLANMSHELRTPLNAIIGFSEMIQKQLLGPIENKTYLEYVGGIHESGNHLLSLISDILDMSKIEAGKYELDLEELKVDKTIQTCLHMMEGRAYESNIKLSYDGTHIENLEIIADRRAVMQILLNILSNAVKFSNEGGHVTIEHQQNEKNIALIITDNGIGIPANKLANIARPFEQASSHYSREHQGSGLGLSITKDLLEMHGGTLKIESEIGIGTTVTITLPHNAYTAKKQKAA